VTVRVAAADDLWLSTAHGRQTGYLAVHQYVRTPRSTRSASSAATTSPRALG